MSARLIDQLVPDLKHGPVEALLATTFEMSGGFVDDDFLPTVLGLGDASRSQLAGRIALQRALASVLSPTVLMDARRYRGGRPSLRLELVPRLGAGASILHAKVVVVVQPGCVKLMVASANLTETGYRKNREVAALFTVTAKDLSDQGLVLQALQPMPDVLARWWTTSADSAWRTALARLQELCGEASVTTSKKASTSKEATEPQEFLWSDSTQPLWERVVGAWPAGERIERVHIVSPFWSPDTGSGPVSRFCAALRERAGMAAAKAFPLVLCAAASPHGEPPLPALPESYAHLVVPGVHVEACAVVRDVDAAEAGSDDVRAVRALHAKLVCIEGAKTTLVYLGSANFTGPGFGFFASANIEAGILLRRSGKARAELLALLPPLSGHRVPLRGDGSAVLAVEHVEDIAASWPACLQEAVLVPSVRDPQRLALRLVFVDVADDLRVVVDGANATPVWASEHVSAGCVDVDLDARVLNAILIARELKVHLRDGPVDGAVVPVNVDVAARYSLPLAPNTGAPSEDALLAYYQGKLSFEELYGEDVDGDGEAIDDDARRAAGDGESEVDPSHIQSYQVRAFIEALPGIERDVAAAATPAALRFALRGPVSPLALAHGIKSRVAARTRTETAAAFQLVELLALLERARATRASHQDKGAAADDEDAVVDDVIDDIAVILDDVCAGAPSGMSKSFERYQRAIRPKARARGRAR